MFSTSAVLGKEFLVLNDLQLCTLFCLFNIFSYSSVTDELFVDETRVCRKYEISILISMMSLIRTYFVR